MYTTLIQAAELHANLGDPNWVVVDCRASLADFAYGSNSFASYHIPGAQRADLEENLSGLKVPGVSGRHPLPDRAQLIAFFCTLGVTKNSQLIAYDDGNSAFAARFWWLARWLGVRSVAVLDGGLQGYLTDFGPGESALTQTSAKIATRKQPHQASAFEADTALTRIVELEQLLAPANDRLLIDARSEARFQGLEEPIDTFAGHIPGAVCMPFDANLNSDQKFKSAEQLHKRFAASISHVSQKVCYCGSGVTAAHNILAMQIAGLGEAALYPGSWSEWIQDPNRKTEPARAEAD